MDVTIKTIRPSGDSRNVTLHLNNDNSVSLLGVIPHGDSIIVNQDLVNSLQDLVNRINGNNGVRSIALFAKRWVKPNSGTYFSCAIYINGKFAHKINYEYGYDKTYEDSAFTWLTENGYTTPLNQYQSLSGYCRNKDIEFITEVSDVKNRSQL